MPRSPIPPCILDEEELKRLVIDAKDFAFSFGLLMRTGESAESADQVSHAPFTLFPTPIPRHCFTDAQIVQTDFNLMMFRIARCPDFLLECLQRVIATDDFTRRLWHICETVHRENEGIPVQPIFLAMNRSDYMIGTEAVDQRFTLSDASSINEQLGTISELSQSSTEGTISEATSLIPTVGAVQQPQLSTDYLSSNRDVPVKETTSASCQLKQIEFNTMAVGAAGLAVKANSLHRFLLASHKLDFNLGNVPNNHAVDGLADAMVQSWRLYGNSRAVVLFLVYNIERNIYDQRWLEHNIHVIDSSVGVIRRTLKDVRTRGHLTSDRHLIVDDMEVALVYFRSCYKPSDYETDDDWESRLMIERSRAIVCPTAAYQLAGTKKVQQVLVKSGVVERFVDGDLAAAQRIRSTFVQQLSIDLNDEGDQNVQRAIEKPHLYVMKPQREGGDNNVFGEAIRTELLRLRRSTERESYILMKKIEPIVACNYAVAWRQNAKLQDMVSEIGIYGTLIAVGDVILVNKQRGFLMRTKCVEVNEGGLMSGSAFLDSPYLVDVNTPSTGDL